MKILVFQKQKNGQYKLKLEDNQELVVYEDLILKYDLLLHKTITDNVLQKLQEENQMYECYYTGLKYLKTKRRSRKELEEYLLKKDYSKDQTEYAILKLVNQGYINDQAYAVAYLHEQLNLNLSGPRKIQEELIKKGISIDFIQQALEEYTKDIEKTKVKKIIEKMIKGNHNKSNIILKRKIENYLSLQGYSKEVISVMLSEVILPNDKIIQEKEREKLYQRLKRKYSGKELEYKIKQKMYQKGFTNEE